MHLSQHNSVSTVMSVMFMSDQVMSLYTACLCLGTFRDKTKAINKKEKIFPCVHLAKKWIPQNRALAATDTDIISPIFRLVLVIFMKIK